MATWRETKPAATDIPNAELASLLTSQKQAFSTGMQQHFYWTESSNVSAGVPRLSDGSFGPGSARAFFGAASLLSGTSPNAKAGALFITSDTSRLIVYNSSTGSVLGASKNALVAAGPAGPTIAAGTRWLVQSGLTQLVTGGSAALNQIFPTAYSATPVVLVQSYSSNATDMWQASLLSANGSGFTYQTWTKAGASGNTYSVMWRSEGTVTI